MEAWREELRKLGIRCNNVEKYIQHLYAKHEALEKEAANALFDALNKREFGFGYVTEHGVVKFDFHGLKTSNREVEDKIDKFVLPHLDKNVRVIIITGKGTTIKLRDHTEHCLRNLGCNFRCLKNNEGALEVLPRNGAIRQKLKLGNYYSILELLE